MIPFGEYLPDQSDLDNPGVTRAENVLPFLNGYGPFKALSAYSDALTARCQGAISVEDKSGNVYNYAGDATKLYSLTDDTWGDVSKVATTYALDATEHWEFVKFKEKVIATGWDSAHAATGYPQFITLGGANFADLTTAFQAKHVAVVRDFVVFGNYWDTSVDIPNGVIWSGINDETTYAASGTTLSDSNTLKNGVQVQRIIGGSSGHIFCETTIHRMEFQSGGRVAFTFDEVDPGVGIHAPGGVCAGGGLIFFLADDGFRVSVSRGPSERIGSEKVNRTMLAELDVANIDRVTSAYDPRSGFVFWGIPAAGGTAGIANKIYLFNSKANRWSTVEVEVEKLYPSGSPGYTLDGLDTINTSIDALTESLDSSVYGGGALQLGAFDNAHKLGYFGGAAMDATIETQELQLANGRKTMLRSVRPEISGGATVTVGVAARNRQQDTETFGSQQSVRDSGRVPLRKVGRYHRFRVQTSGDFKHAIGIGDVEAGAVGRR